MRLFTKHLLLSLGILGAACFEIAGLRTQSFALGIIINLIWIWE